jgi:hypothetical protein
MIIRGVAALLSIQRFKLPAGIACTRYCTPRYEVDNCQEITSAHLSEISDSPGAVARRLIG